MTIDLINQATIKAPKRQGLESFWVEHMEMLGGQCRERGGKLCAPPTPYLDLCISSIWLFLNCSPCNKPVNVSNVSLSFVSPSSKLLNLRRKF